MFLGEKILELHFEHLELLYVGQLLMPELEDELVPSLLS
jgi:hypothetical protein